MDFNILPFLKARLMEVNVFFYSILICMRNNVIVSWKLMGERKGCKLIFERSKLYFAKQEIYIFRIFSKSYCLCAT